MIQGAPENATLKAAFAALEDEPLRPSDYRYVAFYERQGSAAPDPIEQLVRSIEMSEKPTVHFLVGVRGSGRSSELRRLKFRLRERAVHVDRTGQATVQTEGVLRGPAKTAAATERTRELVLGMVGKAPGIPVTPFHARDALEKAGAKVVLLDLFDPEEFPTPAEWRRVFRALRVDVPWPCHVVLETPAFLAFADTGADFVVPADASTWLVPDLLAESASPGHSIAAEVLRRRVGSLLDDAAIEATCRAAGGSFGTLIRIARGALHATTSFPVSGEAVRAQVEKHRAFLRQVVFAAPERLALLRAVHADSDSEVLAPRTPDALYQMMQAGALVVRRDGAVRLAVNPLLADLAQLPAAPAAPAKPFGAPTPGTAASPAPAIEDLRNIELRFQATNYRGLRNADWSLPRGLSVLVGPNGAGKTTLLDLPAFFRDAIEHGFRRAIDERGGAEMFRHLSTVDPEMAHASVLCNTVAWGVGVLPRGHSLLPFVAETVAHDNLPIPVSERPPERGPDAIRSTFVRMAQSVEGRMLAPLLAWTRGYRLYRSYEYNLERVRRAGSPMSSDIVLDERGENVFSVLRNWRDKEETRPWGEFVIDAMREAFPDFMSLLDFEVAGQTVSGRIVPPLGKRRSTFFAPNGWLVMLLHLTAVASAEPGSAIAIDEPENGLHPFAIKRLAEEVDRWMLERNASAVFATHSPVLLDAFKDKPERVFVMDPRRDVVPVRLDELHDPEWLAHFSLGDLYAHLEFGAPRTEP